MTTDALGSKRFVREVGTAAAVADLVEPVLESLGFRLVRILVTGGDAGALQIMAERPDGTITIDDCETISRQLSPVLDVHDPLPGSYRLEISSPGIDRPLVRPTDFEDWSGYEARVELKEAVDGRRRFRGTIEGLTDGEARIACDVEGHGRQVLGFPVGLIAEAKLMLTDDLVREALRRNKAARAEGKKSDGAEISIDEIEVASDAAVERRPGRKSGNKRRNVKD